MPNARSMDLHLYIRNDGKTISEEGRDVGWLVGCMAYYLSCAGKVGYLLWCLILSPSLVPRPRFPTAAGGLHHRYVESGSGS